MDIALAVWQERISPVFDVSRVLRVVSIDAAGRETSRRDVETGDLSPIRRADFVEQLGVTILICGAVSAELARMIAGRGVTLVPFIAGDADEVLVAFLTGDALAERYAQPGCCGKGHRCRGGAGGPGGGAGRGRGCGKQ